MRMATIRVLVFKPGVDHGEVIHLENELPSMQLLVGGYIESAHVGDGFYAVMDEEGKLKRKAMNRPIKRSDGKIYDVIVGTCFVTRVDDEGDFIGLTDEEISKWRAWPMVTIEDIRATMQSPV